MRFLDYKKVKQAERTKAEELFGTADEPTELASKVGLLPPIKWLSEEAYLLGLTDAIQIMGIKSSTFIVPTSNGTATSGSKVKRLKLTDKEKQRLQEKIKKAGSLEEIMQLEKALNEGRLPSGILGDDAMEE